MAVIKRWSSKATPYKVFEYLTQEQKTSPELMHGSHCDPADFARYFTSTSYAYNKNLQYDSRKYYHIIHSFSSEDGVTPEQALELTKEMCERSHLKGCQYAIITHIDTDAEGKSIHCHIVINNLRMESLEHTYNNRARTQVTLKEGNAYKADNYSLWELRRLSNELCHKYGFEHSVIPLDQRSQKKEVYTKEEKYIRERNAKIDRERKEINDAEKLDGRANKQRDRKKTEVWKDTLRDQIKQCTQLAGDIPDFISRMKEYFNVEVKIAKDKNGNEYFLYRTEERERGCTEKRLGASYGKAYIENYIVKNVERQHKFEVKKQAFEEYQRNYASKPHYYINPKWDKKVTFYGKTKYRRRGRIEEILIRAISRERVKVLTYEEFLEKKYGANPTAPTITTVEYNNAMQSLNNSLDVLRIVRENGIHTLKDIQLQKAELINQLLKGQGNPEEIKIKLSELDKAENSYLAFSRNVANGIDNIAVSSNDIIETAEKMRTYKQSAFAISQAMERIQQNFVDCADRSKSLTYRAKALEFAENELHKMDRELNNLRAITGLYAETEDIYIKIGSLMKDGGSKKDFEFNREILKNNCDLLKQYGIKFVPSISKPETLHQDLQMTGLSAEGDSVKVEELSKIKMNIRGDIKDDVIKMVNGLCERAEKFCTSRSEFESMLSDHNLVLKEYESMSSVGTMDYEIHSLDGSIGIDIRETGNSMDKLIERFTQNRIIMEKNTQEIKHITHEVQQPAQVPGRYPETKPQFLSSDEYCNSLKDYRFIIRVEKGQGHNANLSFYERAKIEAMRVSGMDISQASKEYEDKHYENIEIRRHSSFKDVPGWKYSVPMPTNGDRYDDARFYTVSYRDSRNNLIEDNIKGEVLNLYLDGIIKPNMEREGTIYRNIHEDISESKKRILEPLQDKIKELGTVIQNQKQVVDRLERIYEASRMEYQDKLNNRPAFFSGAWEKECAVLEQKCQEQLSGLESAKMQLKQLELTDKRLQTIERSLDSSYNINENQQLNHENHMRNFIDQNRPSRTMSDHDDR